MKDRLFALRVFVRVARSGSFSKAGRELGLSQPSVSRIAAELEKEIGASLFTRTTRVVSLTEAGMDYLERIEPILAALEEADQAIRGTDDLCGSLRVALSSSFAVREIIPLLPAFMQRHPALRVELLMNDQRQDLVQEGADLALRFGELPDSSATARRIGVSPRLLVAAPGYLEQNGMPHIPTDLSGHALIAGPMGKCVWEFRQGEHKASVRVNGRLHVSLGEAAIAAAVVGLGIVQISRWGCRAELERGSLKRVLTDWDTGQVDLHAVFPAGHAAKPSARVFTEYLMQSLRE